MLQLQPPGEHGEGQHTKSPAKLTGVLEQQVILRIASKRRLLYCSEELVSELEDMVPSEGIVEYAGDRLVSFIAK